MNENNRFPAYYCSTFEDAKEEAWIKEHIKHNNNRLDNLEHSIMTTQEPIDEGIVREGNRLC